MKIRAAQTLVFTRDTQGLVGFNFLSGSAFACSTDLLNFLDLLTEWIEIADVPALIPATPVTEATSAIAALLSVGALMEEGSEAAAREEEYQSTWRWGTPAALFHFSIQDKQYLSLEQSESLQLQKLSESPQPPLFLTNEASTRVPVAMPSALTGNDLLQLMAKRRTVRDVSPEPITLAHLSDCLFAGLGITGSTENAAGRLPLSMTPSGGARNPFEAYVYAQRVDGLERGLYHYSAIDHTLGLVTADGLPTPAEMTGGQDWTNGMACVVFLCAFLERTMWKYDDANAYRVVLIEAGHIGQNLMLAATRHGLTACPTAALSHTVINGCLAAKSRTTHAPIYALAIGKPEAALLAA